MDKSNRSKRLALARRKLEWDLMVIELSILFVLAVVGRCMHMFGTHGARANSRWWGEIFFQLIQKRTATVAVGTAKIDSRDTHRDKTACDYFVKKIEHNT